MQTKYSNWSNALSVSIHFNFLRTFVLYKYCVPFIDEINGKRKKISIVWTNFPHFERQQRFTAKSKSIL